MSHPPGRNAAMAAATFCVAFGYLYAFHRLGWFMEDEGVLYYHYLRVYQGKVPYRDFFTGYGPLGYYLHAWAFALFGVSINAIRVLTAVVNATTATGLYLVARRLTSPAFALIPPALFLAMQPGDIAVMVFHNSPYPSWYALGCTVWGTWCVLRCLEAESERQRLTWLVAAGVFGGLTFLLKQNSGTFLLWGITGFLASSPFPRAGDRRAEPLLARILRVAYLAAIPLATVLLVRSYLGTATVLAFVLPVAALALLGARRAFNGDAWRGLARRLLAVSAGVAAAVAPWVLYFAWLMGLWPFLRAILFLGTDVEHNLYVRFPPPEPMTALVLSPLILWGVVAWLAQRRAVAAGTARLGWVLALTAVLFGSVVAWQAQVIGALLQFHYNLWQIYSFTSDGLDNLAAYLAVLVLLASVVVVWRGTRRTALLCVLWIAACSFTLYYPRMDYAHLVGAVPLVYVAATGLLELMRRSVVQGLADGNGRSVRIVFNVVCGLAVSFVVATKSAPKVYSRAMVARTEHGVTLTATPTEALTLERANLYFPIYLERQRQHLAAFRDLIQYIRETTGESEPLFAFPALSMVYFLSGRDNPTRHDYFLGDNVSFSEQLEVIRTLEQQRVRTVVRANVPTDYFVAKGRDFTRLISEYLDERYYLDRRIGPYDVLRRYDAHSQAGDHP